MQGNERLCRARASSIDTVITSCSKRWDDCGDHDHDNGDYRSAWAEVEDDDNDVDDLDATCDGDDDGMATM